MSMTPRARLLATLRCEAVDRAPFRGFGAWPETVARWKTEGYDPDRPPFCFDAWAWHGHWFHPNPPFERRVVKDEGETVLFVNHEGILMRERKNNPSEESYVASLYAKGLDKILGKIGEEATEVAVAGKGGKLDEVVSEVADLWFHTLVLLSYYDLPPDKIYAELERRFGTSGLQEKAGRSR